MVKDYAPKVFKKFRKQTVSTEMYLWNWSQSSLKDPVRTFGHSDCTFIYSYDNRFIIKTLTTMEAQWLRKTLPDYCEVCFIITFFINFIIVCKYSIINFTHQ